MTEFEQIKTELFKACRTSNLLTAQAVKDCGNDDNTTVYYRNRLNAYYDLICNCGLPEEYMIWKREQEQEDEDA